MIHYCGYLQSNAEVMWAFEAFLATTYGPKSALLCGIVATTPIRVLFRC